MSGVWCAFCYISRPDPFYVADQVERLVELRDRARCVAGGNPGEAEVAIIGNRRSGVYHEPGCPDYGKISERNQVPFSTAGEAEAAGYRRAGNC